MVDKFKAIKKVLQESKDLCNDARKMMLIKKIIRTKNQFRKNEKLCPIWPDCDCIVRGRKSDCGERLF